MVVHSVLPAALAGIVEDALAGSGIRHVSHDGDDPVRAAEQAALDDSALALIGPFRSREVAEAVEATAPAGLPLFAPVATWAGVTRDDVGGLEGMPEIAQAASLAPLPVVAFDGVQGADLGAGRTVRLALPFAPTITPWDDLWLGADQTRAAVELVAGCVRSGARSRGALLTAIRDTGRFDGNGDPVDPPVWLWTADEQWSLSPDRPLHG